jgi:IMP and pyridine-specific 5'-nucleotidase
MRLPLTYHVQTHRRDQLIEWIKGLLAVPFVLNSQPAAAYEGHEHVATIATMARSAHQRYADIFRDVEDLINDHIVHQANTPSGFRPRSKLSMLVPSISTFFTPLALEDAFKHEDALRAISSRRFVPPSFNDIRLILNTAQIMSLVKPQHPSRDNSSLTPGSSQLKLLTFDGDVTLYDDGASLISREKDPVIDRLIYFLSRDFRIGIVTAAGYTEPKNYFNRLSGLLLAIRFDSTLTPQQKSNLIIMGGESNFLFVYDDSADHFLRHIPRREWILEAMHDWNEAAIQQLLDVAEGAFKSCIKTLQLKAKVLRKERAVGIYAAEQSEKLTREQLEETVLVVQQVIESSRLPPLPTSPTVSAKPSSPKASTSSLEPPSHAHIPFTVFNGGADVFLDIGDKSLGVQACQKWFGGILPSQTLHVGDQFLSGGGNDFKARSACCCAWIASPAETVGLLDAVRELGG